MRKLTFKCIWDNYNRPYPRWLCNFSLIKENGDIIIPLFVSLHSGPRNEDTNRTRCVRHSFKCIISKVYKGRYVSYPLFSCLQDKVCNLETNGHLSLKLYAVLMAIRITSNSPYDGLSSIKRTTLFSYSSRRLSSASKPHLVS